MTFTAYQYAQISLYAYYGRQMLLTYGFSDVKEFKDDGTNTIGYVCIYKPTKTLVVVFRGTDSKKDWSVNLDFIKFRTPLNRSTHRGFQRAYDSVKYDIDGIIDRYEGYEIHATAHSLGGALACLFTLQSRHYVKATVTFGQPRFMGSNEYTNMSKYSVSRYVNKSDIVAWVPILGYVHTGELYYINSQNEILKNPSPLYIALNSMWSFWNWLSDHKIEKYVSSLKVAKEV